MQYEDLSVFLTVVEEGTLSKAAQKLFTSQSNVSAKIKHLEEETGVPLLIRNKGQRTIELTSHGVRFVELARQIDALNQEIDHLKDQKDRLYLSLGAVDSLNTMTFVPYYESFINNHPKICLSLHTYHTSELYTKLQEHTIDLGFASDLKHGTKIKATPLFNEPMVLLTHIDSPYYDGISPEELPAHLEIFNRWSDEYELWHDQFFEPSHYLLRVSTAGMVADYLTIPGRWAIVGVTTAKHLSERYPITYYHLSITPPDRSFYLLEHLTPRASRAKAISLFKDHLLKSINKQT